MTAFTQPGLHKTQVTGFARLALWAGWLALVALLLVTFAAGVPVRYSHLAVGVEPDDSTLIGELYSTIAVDRLGPQEMHALNGLGLSQRFYAGFILTFEVGLALVCAAIGIFIFWQRPDNWLTLWVSLILVVLGTNGPWTIVPALATVWPYGMWISVLAGALGMISHVHLLFLSPDGRFVPRWTLRFAAGFTGGLLALIFLIGAFFERWGFQTSLALVFLTFLIWMILLGLGVYSQVYRYRRISSPVQRQQTKWLAVGLTTVALGFVINALLVYLSPQSGLPRLMYNLIRPPVVTLFMMLFPVCLGFSILRYRLWDIDLIIRRTLIYSSLTAALALIYFASIVLLQGVVGSFVRGSTPLVTVLSTLAVAALFSPLRRRIQRFIDRRFYRSRYDAQRALDNFALAVRDEVEIESLSESLVSVVQETMQPVQVSLWLRMDDGPRTADDGP